MIKFIDKFKRKILLSLTNYNKTKSNMIFIKFIKHELH